MCNCLLNRTLAFSFATVRNSLLLVKDSCEELWLFQSKCGRHLPGDEINGKIDGIKSFEKR